MLLQSSCRIDMIIIEQSEISKTNVITDIYFKHQHHACYILCYSIIILFYNSLTYYKMYRAAAVK